MGEFCRMVVDREVVRVRGGALFEDGGRKEMRTLFTGEDAVAVAVRERVVSNAKGITK